MNPAPKTIGPFLHIFLGDMSGRSVLVLDPGGWSRRLSTGTGSGSLRNLGTDGNDHHLDLARTSR
jgi:hypothetical protein